MSNYTIHTIASVIHATYLQQIDEDVLVKHLCIDSRRIIDAGHSLFFALHTQKRDGHLYLKTAYEKGVRNFVVSKLIDKTDLGDANILHVPDTLAALHDLTAYHRRMFSIPVIGITGSNGKTIVKEWLYHLLSDAFLIVRSPKSYNSQIGVPLSVWQMQKEHTLAIFEAGISQKGEMQYLQKIIQPTLGVFTNLGNAHENGFATTAEKFAEKSLLFQKTATIIYTPKDTNGFEFTKSTKEIISCGTASTDALQIVFIQKQVSETRVSLKWKSNSFQITIPFIDDASISNVVTCVCVCLHLNMSLEQLQKKILLLKPVSLRLEIKKGLHQCTLINDSYSADLSSFEIALNLLMQQNQHAHKTIILSDFPVSKNQEAETYKAIAREIIAKQIEKVIVIGAIAKNYLQKYLPNTVQLISFASLEELMLQLPSLHFYNEAILIKGARSFALERLMPLLEQQVHQTVLEINLSAVANNLKIIKQKLHNHVKIMGMVKAFSYGSGSFEIANLLQYSGADYLAVAFTDEGVALRKAGITLPIMVMNAETVSFDLLTENNLEPELFSFEQLNSFKSFLENEGTTNYPVHIKIDTGMHRLGFENYELSKLCEQLKQGNCFSIQSVFSHLAASEDAAEDNFTNEQARLFNEACAYIEQQTGATFLKHLSNTSGVLRHTNLQDDMVRLGIGMFGISSTPSAYGLEEALTLKTTIAQLKYLHPGDTVGYNRTGKITTATTIATVRIGYADGYPRNLSNGKGYMFVNGKPAPTIGTVCMDMTMLDVTDIANVKEGDEVLVFGKELSIHEIAKWAATVPYEIMTGISARVKRVYFEE